MATCKLCNKRGLFFQFDNLGLCKKCSYLVNFETDQVIRMVKKSRSIIGKSKKIPIIISITDLILELLDEILLFENQGIYPMKPNIDHFKSLTIRLMNSRLIELLLEKFEDAKTKSDKQVTISAKVNTLNSLLQEIQEIRKLLDKRDKKYKEVWKLTNTCSNDAAILIENAYFNDHLLKAELFEDKDNIKKALYHYLKAKKIIENNLRLVAAIEDKSIIEEINNKIKKYQQ